LLVLVLGGLGLGRVVVTTGGAAARAVRRLAVARRPGLGGLAALVVRGVLDRMLGRALAVDAGVGDSPADRLAVGHLDGEDAVGEGGDRASVLAAVDDAVA